MKKIVFALHILLAATVCQAQTLDRSVKPKPGPAPEIKLGHTESFTLSNGLKVFVVENHKLPTIAISLQLDIRPELQGDMTGFQDVMSELLLGGTKSRTMDQLNKEIDFIGATLQAHARGAYASGLKKHQEKIMELMADVLMNAQFSQEELEKQTKRMLSGLEAGENDPDEMMSNAKSAIVYGTKHPYGEVVTKQTLKQITLDRCQQYYKTYFRPNVAYMAIVGDITRAEAESLVKKYFSNWQKADVPVTQYGNVANVKATAVAFVPRDAAVQSVINVTYPVDLPYGSPDVVKVKLLNSILGGGASGRLFQNLREKHAWTYGSYSSVSEDELKSDLTLYAKCRNEVTDSAIVEMLSEMKRLRTEKITQEELRNHINMLTGLFSMGLENPAKVAQYAINIEKYNMPKDYYQQYLKNLSAVTVDDIQKTAQKYLLPDNAHIIVVGNKEDVADKLIKFDADGKIAYYDSYGQPLKESDKKAIPAGMTANKVIENYINAIGGKKVLASIKDMKMVSKGDLQGISLVITRAKKDPGKFKMDITGMGMTLQKLVLNGDAGYQEIQGQKAPLTEEDIQDAKMTADICPDCNPSVYGYSYNLKGLEEWNGKDVYVIETTDAKGDKNTRYFDAQSFYLLKESAVESLPSGDVTVSTEYDNYKEVPGFPGYKVPYTVKLPLGPGMFLLTEIETVTVNTGLADTEFE